MLNQVEYYEHDDHRLVRKWTWDWRVPADRQRVVTTVVRTALTNAKGGA